jgi:hypothetical protein
MSKKLKFLKLFEEIYRNPYNPDEIWDTTEVIIDELNKNEINDYVDSLVGKTIEFYIFWNRKIGPVKLVDWDLDLPEDAYYPRHIFFINDKGYNGEGNVDYFEIDNSKPIKVID